MTRCTWAWTPQRKHVLRISPPASHIFAACSPWCWPVATAEAGQGAERAALVYRNWMCSSEMWGWAGPRLVRDPAALVGRGGHCSELGRGPCQLSDRIGSRFLIARAQPCAQQNWPRTTVRTQNSRHLTIHDVFMLKGGRRRLQRSDPAAGIAPACTPSVWVSRGACRPRQ